MNEKIENERYLLLQKQMPSMIAASILGGVGIVYMFWDIFPHDLLLSWFAILSVYWVFRGFYARYQFKQFQQRSPSEAEKKYYLLFPAVSGMIWAVASVIFFPQDSMIHLVYMLMYLFALTAGGGQLPWPTSVGHTPFICSFPFCLLCLFWQCKMMRLIRG